MPDLILFLCGFDSSLLPFSVLDLFEQININGRKSKAHNVSFVFLDMLVGKRGSKRAIECDEETRQTVHVSDISDQNNKAKAAGK